MMHTHSINSTALRSDGNSTFPSHQIKHHDRYQIDQKWIYQFRNTCMLRQPQTVKTGWSVPIPNSKIHFCFVAMPLPDAIVICTKSERSHYYLKISDSITLKVLQNPYRSHSPPIHPWERNGQNGRWFLLLASLYYEEDTQKLHTIPLSPDVTVILNF